MPEASPLAKVLRVASLAVKERGSAREMVQTRCERGADIAAHAGLRRRRPARPSARSTSTGTAAACRRARGRQIPLGGRILGLAQSVEVFASAYGVDSALAVASERSGTLVRSRPGGRAEKPAAGPRLLGTGAGLRSRARTLAGLEPEDQVLVADDARLDVIAAAFARVIDAKSPYTYPSLERVSPKRPMGIGQTLELEGAELRDLRRAALCCTTSASSASPT